MPLENDPWSSGKQVFVLPDGRNMRFVEQEGQGPTLLCLHGYTDSSRSFQLLAEHLSGQHLLIPDLSGHGGSQASEEISLASMVADVRALAQNRGIGDCVLVGHSMGSMLALHLASRGSLAVSGLILIGGACRPRFPAGLMEAIAALEDPIPVDHSVLSGWHECAMPVEQMFLQHLADEAAAIPSRIWKALAKEMQDAEFSGLAETITVPVLSIGGTIDTLFAPAERRALVSHLANARAVELEGHGHNPHWESPAMIARLIQSLLAERVVSSKSAMA